MTEIIDINEKAKAAAEEASKPGKFSFLDRVLGRNYPTEEIGVFLDEAAGYQIDKVEAQLDTIRGRLKLYKENEEIGKQLREEMEHLDSELEALREKAAESRFVFHLEGIPSAEYDKIVDAARAEFPYEYRETRNPLTFATERTVVESEERDTFFRTHLWAKFVRRVVDPDGNSDDNITPAWVAQVLGYVPIVGVLKVQQAIDKLRMTTDWMDGLQGEDFLAKS